MNYPKLTKEQEEQLNRNHFLCTFCLAEGKENHVTSGNVGKQGLSMCDEHYKEWEYEREEKKERVKRIIEDLRKEQCDSKSPSLFCSGCLAKLCAEFLEVFYGI